MFGGTQASLSLLASDDEILSLDFFVGHEVFRSQDPSLLEPATHDSDSFFLPQTGSFLSFFNQTHRVNEDSERHATKRSSSSFSSSGFCERMLSAVTGLRGV